VRTILFLNSKGGCGKSTLATNLAAYYAREGKTVVLADFDPQGSSLAWLEARPKEAPAIRGIAAFREPLRVPRQTDYVIFDAPAGIAGPALTAILRRAQTVIIPVLPSATDIRAAARFIHHLLLAGRVERKQTRLATVANRVPQASLLEGAMERALNNVNIAYTSVATRLYRPLERFLDRLNIPFVAALPDSPSYALADQQGRSIFELADGRAARDRLAWEPLLAWLDSRRSLPHKA
jgi:chromosome partitioning protein